MPLAPGTRLGPYEILAAIGAGGMGEVYRARDTKLERDVAIKVLPDELASDAERLARFEREAKVLASLNHPNIAAIHGFEESDGVNALVLELVEGPTLAERIEQGAVPVDEAVAIAKQIAEALDAGHEAGVVHRDLKPANIKLKEDGTVKVLDYGLAKALEGETAAGVDSELSQSPTLTRQTQVGVILGTAAYMSPEQAKGKRVDKRTDIWSFGAVVYEMLTGRRAFAGEDVSDTLASILKSEPDFGKVPAELRPLLRLCLRKDARRRARDIGDVALALAGEFERPAERERRVPSSRLVVAAAFGAGALAAASTAWVFLRPEPANVLRFTTEVGKLFATPGEGAKITPDGRTLVYVGIRDGELQVFRRPLDEPEATPIPGTEGAQQIVLSPDGRSVGFYGEGRQFKVVPITGGAGLEFPLAISPRGFAWRDDGSIVLGSASGGLWSVPDVGGEPERLTEADPGRNHNRPFALSDRRGLLFNDWSAGDTRIAFLPAGSREPKVVVEGEAPSLTSTGHLLFQRDDSLWAAPFDRGRLEIVGSPIRVIRGIDRPGAGAKRYDVAEDGTLIFIPSATEPDGPRGIDWVSRDGERTRIGELAWAYYARFSPDGTRVAVAQDTLGGGIWVFDLERRSRTRTYASGAGNVVWTPDGERIVFMANADGIGRAVAADGSGADEILYQGEGRGVRPWSWSDDGQVLVLDAVNPVRGDRDVLVMRKGEELEPLLATDANEKLPRFSADGRYLAYVSDESGRDEVLVQRYPDMVEKWAVSIESGTSPEWARDGRALFFRSQGRLMVADVQTEPAFEISTPRTLLGADQLARYEEAFDVSPDGEGFLFVETAPLQENRSLVVILNWFEELKRLVPVD